MVRVIGREQVRRWRQSGFERRERTTTTTRTSKQGATTRALRRRGRTGDADSKRVCGVEWGVCVGFGGRECVWGGYVRVGCRSGEV
jgi:hypothetical protein